MTEILNMKSRYIVKDQKESEIFYEKNMKNKNDLRVFAIENGYILPTICVDKKSERFAGGILDSEKKFVAGLFRGGINDRCWADVYCGYDFRNQETVLEKKIVIFGGCIIDHFGHIVLEGFNRLWYVIQHPEINYEIVFISVRKNVKQYFFDFWELLGIKDRCRIIDKITRFSKIFVPEESAHANTTFTKEYLIPYSKIISSVPKLESKKIYISRTRFLLKEPRIRILGESFFENFFKNLGYKVIYPEQMSVTDQIAEVHSASEIVTTLGTLSHFAIFCKPNTTFIILQRGNDQFLAPQRIINQASLVNYIFVDVSYNLFYSNISRGINLIGPTVFFKKFVNEYFNVDISEQIDFELLNSYLRYFYSMYNSNKFTEIQSITMYDILNEVRKILDLPELIVNKVENRQNNSLLTSLNEKIRLLEIENATLKNIINSSGIRTFLSYKAHISNIGWVDYLTEKSNIGCCDINTKSRCNHIEAINISSSNHEFQLKYKVKIKNNGWSQLVDDGKDAGTTGKSLPLQGFVLFFDNEKYLIKYRVFWSDHTVSEWVDNGTILESEDLDILGMQFQVEDLIKKMLKL